MKSEDKPITTMPRGDGPSIRAATASDIATLLSLERESATAAHWSEVEYQKLFAPGILERIALVIEAEGRLAGFLVARMVSTECELENILVEESGRRKGLGRRLLAELVKRAKAREVTTIFLEVRASNWSARAFYRAHGFQESGVRKSYYVAPVEDAVLYRLQT